MEGETTASLLDFLISLARILALGFITMKVAEYRGAVGSATLWFICGALLFIIAFPAALIVKVDRKKLNRRRVNNCESSPYFWFAVRMLAMQERLGKLSQKFWRRDQFSRGEQSNLFK